MYVVIIGLNHKTAPVEVREKAAVAKHRLQEWLKDVFQDEAVEATAILSTCNRTEIYLIASDVDKGIFAGKNFFGKLSQLDVADLNQYLYYYTLQEAVRHLFRVSAGLDSMILGESQILGQVQEAYQYTLEAGTTNGVMNNLFKQAIVTGKRVRTETLIDRQAVSVSSAAVELAKQELGELTGRTVLILGAGETSELTARHLVSNGVSSVIVANRTYERAQSLAQEFGGSAVRFDDFYKCLKYADIVISCTSAPHYIIEPKELVPVMEERNKKPLFFIDIAVPRDIDPAVAQLPFVSVYDVDDLMYVVDKNMNERKKEAVNAEEIVAKEVGNFYSWLNSLYVVPTIVALKNKGEQIKQKELERVFHKLSNLNEKDKKVIGSLANSIINQLLHEPIHQLKEYASNQQGQTYSEALQQLFKLQIEGQSEKKDVVPIKCQLN